MQERAEGDTRARTRPVVDVADLRGLTHAQSMRLAERQFDELIALLRRLDVSDWDKPTDCERWKVRDIVAHVLGWAQALLSPSEMWRQSRQTRRIRAELGVKLDAQNEAQVRSRRGLAPAELLEALDVAGRRFLRLRRAGAFVGRAVPLVVHPVGLTNAGFLLGQIFTRDHFMHRIDIARATGKEIVLDDDDGALVADVVRHWTRNSKADTRLVLEGPAGGDFLCGLGDVAVIRGDAVEFCRLLAGRAGTSVMQVEGDATRARRWLEAPVPF